MTSSRFSRLGPLPLDKRIELARVALDFFSPMSYEKVSTIIERPPTPGRTEPLEGADLLKYLDRTGILPAPRKYAARLKDLLDKLESVGLLAFMGHGRDVQLGKRYYFMKELTLLERKGLLWLAPALGPEFLYSTYSSITVQITGVDGNGDIHAGSALSIAPNWLLTCAHVLTDMDIHNEQHLQGKKFQVVKQIPHGFHDVGLIKVEPALTILDALSFRDPVLSETMFTLGFPFIPLSRDPVLVMQRGEVTTPSVQLLDGSEVFLYSAIARPGNSGGPILAETGHVLGMVTQQLERQDLKQAFPFHAGLCTQTILSAIQELEPSLQLPLESYE
jgi:hypothetical protein